MKHAGSAPAAAPGSTGGTSRGAPTVEEGSGRPGAGTGTDNSFVTNPWPPLILGLLMTAAAALWFSYSGHAAPALVFLGLLASGKDK